MWIRKRRSLTRRGVRERHQVIETYREDGKVRQKAICSLGRDSTPQEALARARSLLRVYSQGRIRSPRSKERVLKQKKRVELLERVVAKWSLRTELREGGP
jgi:hypothetical protein